jgi:hypothetical protein
VSQCLLAATLDGSVAWQSRKARLSQNKLFGRLGWAQIVTLRHFSHS